MGYDFLNEAPEFVELLDALNRAVETIHFEFCGKEGHHPACWDVARILEQHRPDWLKDTGSV